MNKRKVFWWKVEKKLDNLKSSNQHYKENEMIFLKRFRREKYGYDKYDEKQIVIGDFTYGQCQIMKYDGVTKLSIGKFCSIASGVKIMMGGEHNTNWISTYPFNQFISDFNSIKGQPTTKGDIKIGNDVWIGMDATILSGVTVGNGAVIGTGSVVAKDVPPYAIVVGNPARIIKYRFNTETIDLLEKVKWWDWEYELLYDAIPILQSGNFEQFLEFCNKRIKIAVKKD